ncbi:hypothetical protein D3C86_2251930 [compost metagenome]
MLREEGSYVEVHEIGRANLGHRAFIPPRQVLAPAEQIMEQRDDAAEVRLAGAVHE